MENSSEDTITISASFSLYYLLSWYKKVKYCYGLYNNIINDLQSLHPLWALNGTKYLLYSKILKPELTEEAHTALVQFYVSIGKIGVSGLPRKLDSLTRLAIATAKLKLKNIADANDAQEVIKFYNDILKNFNQAIHLSKNPRDLTYDLIRQIIKEHNGSPILLTDAAKTACDRDSSVKCHLLGKKKKSLKTLSITITIAIIKTN